MIGICFSNFGIFQVTDTKKQRCRNPIQGNVDNCIFQWIQTEIDAQETQANKSHTFTQKTQIERKETLQTMCGCAIPYQIAWIFRDSLSGYWPPSPNLRKTYCNFCWQFMTTIRILGIPGLDGNGSYWIKLDNMDDIWQRK